jgi:EAL domain-containing protein (putative c-di-GMP-specific phosphodiesterase class I)
VEGLEVYMTACIGVTVNTCKVGEPLVLLSEAETALHAAKRIGFGSVRRYTPSAGSSRFKRMDMESRLRRAVRDGKLCLHYQPQKDIFTNRFYGVEALLRWHDDELGHVSPGQFIPVAEESNLILELGEWVLQEACRQAREWRGRWQTEIQMGVNVSSLQFRRQDLPKLLLTALQYSGALASTLQIELTESAVMNDSDASLRALERLKDLGVSLAIDDFGTGYSSLSYLSRFPLDTLKIDRSFVKDFPGKNHDAAIVSAIIAMAESLGLRVIAEGVETEDQLDGLRAHHCHAVQGFLFARPMPAEVCAELFDRELLRISA